MGGQQAGRRLLFGTERCQAWAASSYISVSAYAGWGRLRPHGVATRQGEARAAVVAKARGAGEAHRHASCLGRAQLALLRVAGAGAGAAAA